MQTRDQRIVKAIEAGFAEATVRIVDDSAKHAHHAGARAEGQTHYTLQVVSPAFAGQSRLARSRAVHAALDAEFSTGLHALSLKLLTPEEAAQGA